MLTAVSGVIYGMPFFTTNMYMVYFTVVWLASGRENRRVLFWSTFNYSTGKRAIVSLYLGLCISMAGHVPWGFSPIDYS